MTKLVVTASVATLLFLYCAADVQASSRQQCLGDTGYGAAASADSWDSVIGLCKRASAAFANAWKKAFDRLWKAGGDFYNRYPVYIEEVFTPTITDELCRASQDPLEVNTCKLSGTSPNSGVWRGIYERNGVQVKMQSAHPDIVDIEIQDNGVMVATLLREGVAVIALTFLEDGYPLGTIAIPYAVPAEAPTTPTGLNVTAADQSLMVEWNPVEGATAYDVQWTSGGDDFSSDRQMEVQETTTTIVDLMNGVTYSVRVRATNAGGNSEWSSPQTETPESEAPTTPTGLNVTAADQSLMVEWNPVEGATAYDVQWTSGGDDFSSDRQMEVQETTTTIVDLMNGVTYSVRVRATNAGGNSEWSSPQTETPESEAPTTPTGLNVTAADQSLMVEWNPVEGATAYDVQWTSGGDDFSSDRQMEVQETTTTIVDLMNGVTYSVRVRATNAGGNSEWSSPQTETPESEAPTTPTGLNVTAADQSLMVEWNPVEGATAYDVQWTSGGDDFSSDRQMEVQETTTTIVDLMNGVTYSVRVRATNAGGNSEWSSPQTGMPGTPVPALPLGGTGLLAAILGGLSVLLRRRAARAARGNWALSETRL